MPRYLPRTGTSPRYAFADIAASTTDGVVIAAPSSSTRRYRILSVVFLCGATATTATFNSKGSGAGTAISMAFQNGSNSGAVLGFNEAGWFQTNVGEGLTLTTGSGSTTGVQVTYVEW